MKYVLRDPRPLAEKWTQDARFSSLERVRVNPVDPIRTADAIAAVEGRHCYLQHLYADNRRLGVWFKSQDLRRRYWSAYLERMLKRLIALRPQLSLLAIDHPPLGWDPKAGVAHRFTPAWQDTFEYWVAQIHLNIRVPVAQFGVTSNSAVLYEAPFENMRVDGDTRRFAWVNMPGQHAFSDRDTLLEEFHLAIAYCKAEAFDTVILWSDPRKPSDPSDRDDRITEGEFAEVMRAIDVLDPEPADIEFGPRDGETYREFLDRLAEQSEAIGAA